MAKEATLQVRMDADLKEKAESLYRDMGTSFAEAVRIFAKQSVQENGMPFVITANRKIPMGGFPSMQIHSWQRRKKVHMKGRW